MSSSSRTRSVSMRPGISWLTRIRSGASSTASVLASAETEARRTLESVRFAIGSLTDEDVAKRIAPPPALRIAGIARRARRIAERTSSSKALCQAASSMSANFPAGGPPELVKSRSSRPKRAEGFVAPGFERGARPHVGRQGQHRGAGLGGDRGAGLSDRVRLARADRDGRSLGRERPRHGEAEARGWRRRPSRLFPSGRGP